MVLGVLLRKLGEICAWGSGLLQDILGFRLDLVHLISLFSDRIEKNPPDLDAVLHPVVVLVGLIVSPKLRLRNLDSSGDAILVD